MIITHKVPWTFAIKSWFSEKDLFRYGHSGNNLTEVSGSRYIYKDIIYLPLPRLATTLKWSGAPATKLDVDSQNVLVQKIRVGRNIMLMFAIIVHSKF